MKIKNIIKIVFIATSVFILGIQSSNAQIIDSKNKVEYMSDDSEVDELNSISASSIKKVTGVPVQRTKSRASTKEESNISVEDLQKIANLRFRKKRGVSEKCKKETEKPCDSIEEKKKQLDKIK